MADGAAGASTSIPQQDLLEILRIVSQLPSDEQASQAGSKASQSASPYATGGGLGDATSANGTATTALQQWAAAQTQANQRQEQSLYAQRQQQTQQGASSPGAVQLLTSLLAASAQQQQQQQSRSAADAGASLAAILQPLVASRASAVVQGGPSSSLAGLGQQQMAAIEAAFELAFQTVSSASSSMRDVQTALDRLCLAMGFGKPKIHAEPSAGGQFRAFVSVGDNPPFAESTLESEERAIHAALSAALVRACQHARERHGVGRAQAGAAAATAPSTFPYARQGMQLVSGSWGAAGGAGRTAAPSLPFFPRLRGFADMRVEWLLEGSLSPQLAEEQIPYPSPLRPSLFGYQDNVLYRAVLEVKPSDRVCALRQQYVQRIVDAVEGASPSAQAALFGSVVTGTDVLASDVNVHVSDPKEPDAARLMGLVLPRVAAAAVGTVSTLQTLWGPMLRVAAPPGVVCNVLFNAPACLRSTRLLARFTERLPELIPLTRILKLWRWRRAVPDGPDGIPSYAWSVLAVAFLVSRRPEEMTTTSMFEVLRGFFNAYSGLPEGGSHAATARKGILRRQGLRGWLTVENPEAEAARAVPPDSRIAAALAAVTRIPPEPAIACVPSDSVVRTEIIRAANLLTEASKNPAILVNQFLAPRAAGQLQAVLGALGSLAGAAPAGDLAAPAPHSSPQATSPPAPVPASSSSSSGRRASPPSPSSPPSSRGRARERARSPGGSDEEDARSVGSSSGARGGGGPPAAPPRPPLPRPLAPGHVKLAKGRLYRFGAGTPASPFYFAEVTLVEAPRTGQHLPACSTRDAGVRVHLRFYELREACEGRSRWPCGPSPASTRAPPPPRPPPSSPSSTPGPARGRPRPGPPERIVLTAAECRAAGVLEIAPPDARPLPGESAFEVRASFLRPAGEEAPEPPPAPAPAPAPVAAFFRAPPPVPPLEHLPDAPPVEEEEEEEEGERREAPAAAAGAPAAAAARGAPAVFKTAPDVRAMEEEEDWELEGSISVGSEGGSEAGESSPPASPRPRPISPDPPDAPSASAGAPPDPEPPPPPPEGPPAGADGMDVSDGDGGGEEAGSEAGSDDSGVTVVIDHVVCEIDDDWER
eukprot:tig00021582_g22627.t1